MQPMPTPPNPLDAALRLKAHQSAALIPFGDVTLRYTPTDHARVSGFSGGEITLQGKHLTLDAVKAVSLREAFDNAAEAIAGI